MQQSPTVIRARQLRQNANEAERALWSLLRGRQLGGYKFTRQFPVGPYFADFACRRHFLLIELDGSQHTDNPHDRERDQYLLNEGYSVLRVPSASVLSDSRALCDTILAALDGRMDDIIMAEDLRFVRSRAVPRRFIRRRPWATGC